MVCFIKSSDWRILLLPELLGPKKPVMGLNIISPESLQDLKLSSRNRVNIVCPSYEQRLKE